LITTAASVAVCKAIEKVTGISCRIKWVNDIYKGGKKICGILTEAATDFESGNIDYIVLGIGINYNAPESGFPAELSGIAGSLYEEREIDNNGVAQEISCNARRDERTGCARTQTYASEDERSQQHSSTRN
jgi:BirA family biotin operon repressor/biotin-[acetyl-CoA-carboxylase] ligase